MTQETVKLPYQNPALPLEERVADLLSRMTLAEKIAQLGSIWVFEVLEDMKFSETRAKKLFGQGLGQVTRIGGASSLDPAAGAELANTIQKYLLENTRLGIPAKVHEECCSGYMARNATCFPQIIGVASTWEPELVEAMAAVVRTQMRAAGAHQGLSPVIDVTREPRWGRTEETFGEDPYLVARMGVAFVRGLQGQNWQEGVIATAKHF
ncbi:MAG: beta-glucosidase, partial [Chloroflexi bacterium]|nr:beta-glucosidase [Chloroflexota bacterium]